MPLPSRRVPFGTANHVASCRPVRTAARTILSNLKSSSPASALTLPCSQHHEQPSPSYTRKRRDHHLPPQSPKPSQRSGSWSQKRPGWLVASSTSHRPHYLTTEHLAFYVRAPESPHPSALHFIAVRAVAIRPLPSSLTINIHWWRFTAVVAAW